MPPATVARLFSVRMRRGLQRWNTDHFWVGVCTSLSKAGHLPVYAEIVAFLTRPRERARRVVRELACRMELGNCPGQTKLANTVALHIRHGDKPSTQGIDATRIDGVIKARAHRFPPIF